MASFGSLNQVFSSLMIESIGQSGDVPQKNIFKAYVKALKENKLLKLQFLIHSNLTEYVEPDAVIAREYVIENIKMLDGISRSRLIKENEKLVELLGEHKVEEVDEITEAIDYLILTKKTPINIVEWNDKVTKVVTYITNNKPKVIGESVDLPRTMFTELVIDKFNSRYSELSESDMALIKQMVEGGVEDQKHLYATVIKECLDLIKTKLSENPDIETKGKLLEVKEKLLEDSVNADKVDYVIEIPRLANLKMALSPQTN